MEDIIDTGQVNQSETIEDVYALKVEIDESNLGKLRRNLQQTRYELAQIESQIRRVKSESVTPFAAVDKVDNSQGLKTLMQQRRALRQEEQQYLDQMRNSMLTQPDTVNRITSALKYLNREFEVAGVNADRVGAAMSIIEAAASRMASISSRSNEFKQLQESLKDFGVDIDVRKPKKDLSDLTTLQQSINNTTTTVKVDGQSITVAIGEIKTLEALLTQVAAKVQKNIQMEAAYANTAFSRIITPAAGGSQIMPRPRLMDTRPVSTPVGRDEQRGPGPFEVVLAASKGATPFWPSLNTQVRGGRDSFASVRGVATDEVKAQLVKDGLLVEGPSKNQFGTFDNTFYLNAEPKLLDTKYTGYTKTIDPVIAKEMAYIGQRWNKGKPWTLRGQTSAIMQSILTDEKLSQIERAYYYQATKQLAMYNQEWPDVGGSEYWRRGTASTNLTERQLAMLNMVDQFGGGLQTSEMTKFLLTGHYQASTSDKRDLMKKGMLRTAVVPPVPMPEYGVTNRMHPALMAMAALDPKLFIESTEAASPIKLMETTERGRQVLEMMGMYSDPSRINTSMHLNALADEPTRISIAKQRVRFPIDSKADDQRHLSLKGDEHLVYLENNLGQRVIYQLEEFLNNMDAFSDKFKENTLKYVPTYKDASGRMRVDVDKWRDPNSGYQLYPTSIAQYMSARSDIVLAQRTPYMFMDEIMENLAMPKKDMYANTMYGGDMYRRAMLNFATAKSGTGINPQMEKYVSNPDQAISMFQSLWGAYKVDRELSKKSGEYKAETGREYIPWNQYEKSVILRAMMINLEKALPVTSGQEVGVIEALRYKDFMWRGEKNAATGEVDKIRRLEAEHLFSKVNDFGDFASELKKYQRSVYQVANPVDKEDVGTTIQDVVQGMIRVVTPKWRAEVESDQDAPGSWKRYPEFYGAEYGTSYAGIYKGKYGGSGHIGGKDAQMLSRITSVEGSTIGNAIEFNNPLVNQFAKEAMWPPVKAFTGQLNWNAILKHAASMGPGELKPEAKGEYERLMANPGEIMKELYFDFGDVINDTYGTKMVKHPEFGRVVQHASPEARSEYQTRMMQFEKELEDIDDMYPDEKTARGMKEVIGRAMDRFYRQWSNKWGLNYEPTGDMAIRMSDKHFFAYRKHSVPFENASNPEESIQGRMLYEYEQGRMSQGLVEKYATVIANQKMAGSRSIPESWVIERMWRMSGNDYSEMGGLRDTEMAGLLKSFVQTRGEGTVAESAIANALGVNSLNMIDDELLDKIVRHNDDAREALFELIEDNQDMSRSDIESFIDFKTQANRRRLKVGLDRWMSGAGNEEQIDAFMESTGVNIGKIAEEDFDVTAWNPPSAQTEFGELKRGLQLVRDLKEKYWARFPKKWKEGAITQGVEDAQWKQLQDFRTNPKRDNKENEIVTPNKIRSFPSKMTFNDAIIPSFGSFIPEDMLGQKFSMGGFEIDPNSYVSKINKMLPVQSTNLPEVKSDISYSKFGYDGYYNFITHQIGANPNNENIDTVLRHELYHSLSVPKLVEGNRLQSMVSYFKENNIKVSSHGAAVGDMMVESNKRVPYSDMITGYLNYISKEQPDKYNAEAARLAPILKFFTTATDKDIANFGILGEEISIVLQSFDENFDKHVIAMFGENASLQHKQRVAYIRNLMGIHTEFPTEGIRALPAGKEIPLLPEAIPMGEMPRLNESVTGMFDNAPTSEMPAFGPERVDRNVWERLQVKLALRKSRRMEAFQQYIKGLPDVSLEKPGKLVTGRGIEIPVSARWDSTNEAGGIEGVRGNVAGFLTNLKAAGYDVSKLEQDVSVTSKDGNDFGMGSVSGRIRVSRGDIKGRSYAEMADEIRGLANGGLATTNEKMLNFEDTMGRMPSKMEKFIASTKGIGDLSWKFTTLQMAALGIFFSMMSIVSVMGQGIGMVLGSMGDLESMMKAKALAGMSGQFTDDKGNVLSGAYIDERLGINDQTRLDAWKNFTDLTSTLTTIFSGFGSKLMTNPDFLKSADTMVNRILNIFSDEGNFATAVSLSTTLFETIGDTAENIPGLIKLFDTIASMNVPDWVPGLGGKSLLATGMIAGLGALIAMPILAGITLLAKSIGITGSVAERGARLYGWAQGRKLESGLIEAGFPDWYAKLAREGKGIPDVSKAELDEIAKRLKMADDLEKAGGKFTAVVDDLTMKLMPFANRLPKPVLAAVGIGVAATAAASAAETPNVAPEVAAASSIVEDGASKWKWVKKGTTAGISLAPAVAGAINPDLIPLTDPMGNASMLAGPMIRAGVGTGVASAITAPAAVIMSATPAGGGDIAQSRDMMVERVRKPWMGLVDLPGWTSYAYTNPDTGEEIPGFTAKDWDVSKAMGRGENVPGFEEYDWEIAKRRANGLADEPLNSKWTKEGAGTFSQTNYITMQLVDDRLNTMDAKLNAVMKMMGA